MKQTKVDLQDYPLKLIFIIRKKILYVVQN